MAALVVYPMNALVNSQLLALETLRERYQAGDGTSFPGDICQVHRRIRGRQTRAEIRQHPPQIMLTNYVMGELMLVRPEDQRFLDRVGGGLRFLVFDELHTYRGRQARTWPCSSAGSRSVVRHPVWCMWAPAPRWWPTGCAPRVAAAGYGRRFRATALRSSLRPPTRWSRRTLVPFTKGGAPAQVELVGRMGRHTDYG